MKKVLLVFVAIFVFSSLLVSVPAFSESKHQLFAQLNQAKQDYLKAISDLNSANRELRRQCDLQKQAHYTQTEAEKVELRKTYKYNFLDADLDKRLAYRDKTKAIDSKHRAYVKNLDEKVTDAYAQSEKTKKELRKQLFNTRQDIEAKLKAMQ